MDPNQSRPTLERTLTDMSYENDDPLILDTTNVNTVYDCSVIDSDSDLTVDLTNSPKQRPTSGSSDNDLMEDEALAFLMEAGLDNPDDLKNLGIDIDEIRTQRQIESNINSRLPRSSNEGSSSSSTPYMAHHYTSSAAGPSTIVPVKAEPFMAAPSKGKQPSTSSPSFLSPFNSDFNHIEVLDDEEFGEELIDLTNEDDINTSPEWWIIDDDDDDEEEDDDEVEIISSLFGPPSTSSSHVMRVPKHSASQRAAPYQIPPIIGLPGPRSNRARLHQILRQQLPIDLSQDHLSGTNTQVQEDDITLAGIAMDIHGTLSNPDQELRELLRNMDYDQPPPPEDRTGTPAGLTCNLLEHQKIGLQWMINKENSVNKGGLLADDMGLGKTIQALATILAKPCISADEIPDVIPPSRAHIKYKVKATLIVCPVSLIDQWRREIEGKTSPRLNVLAFHGKRTDNVKKIANYDVIVTSYGIASTNFGGKNMMPGVLARVIFHRVILDEAHMIKNQSTRMAVACCQIEATYRWCLTATPIQNKVEELYSLIKFLRIRPFCDWTEFRTTISGPMKKGGSTSYRHAVRAAQVLMKAISLRRSKKTLIDGRPILNLPERNVHMTHIDFSPDERTFYSALNDRVQARFNAYVRAGTVMKNYSSVLVLLLRLRQACLHPELTLTECDDPSAFLDDGSGPASPEDVARKMKPEVVTRILNSDNSLSEIECPICMDVAENAQIISGCGHILCKECFDGYCNSNGMTAKRCPQCRGDLDPRALVTVEAFLKVHAPDQYEEARQEITEDEIVNLQELARLLSSTKIDKMLEILDGIKEETNGKDKTICFSQFTSFLNLVEEPLKKNGHKYLRYDGSMSIKQRADTVNQFFEDPSITCLLVSTKCGSLGLNLTVANRVILMDLWWNPAIENQAIDRVHRIGQAKSVDVHRLFINNSVEDRILALQQKKQALADSVLGEGGTGNMARLGLNELIYLFRGGELPTSSTSNSNQRFS
ncbi:hypothetical protein K501DRAFT_334481 [Backusella circina FSU 941]|nr:hypothetical protein K501DRAFT_334481 [Backusella circina FSU 941]